MDLIEQRNRVLSSIRAKYNGRAEHTLSIEFLLTQQEYKLVAGQLIADYVSVQSVYNLGTNDNKVKVTIGIL